MTKIDLCRATLRTLADWDTVLIEESGLPGPRANLELAHAQALEGGDKLLECRGRGASRPRQAPDVTVVRVWRRRRALDHAGEPIEEAPVAA